MKHIDLELERQLTAYAFAEGCQNWIVDAFTSQECRKVVSFCKAHGPQLLSDAVLKAIGVDIDFARSVIMRDDRPVTSSMAYNSYCRLADLHRRRVEQAQLDERTARLCDYSTPLRASSKSWYTLEERTERFAQSISLRGAGLKFGWSFVDEFIGGLGSKRVMTIVAASGVGKTALAMNILERVCAFNPVRSIFFSFEMDEESQVKREMEIFTRIEPSKIYRSAKEKAFRSEYYHENPLNRVAVVYDQMGLEQMESVVKEYREDYGSCSLVVIDYLQFVTHDPHKTSVNRLMEELKQWAKRIDVAVILLAQLDKSAARTDKSTGKTAKPNGFDALGGVGIQANSDYVVAMWRDGKDMYARFAKARMMNNPSLRDVEYRLEMRGLRIDEWTPISEEPAEL